MAAMKPFLILLLALCLVASTQAQAPAAPGAAPVLNSDQLDQLLGPIALYPDSLIALILPASTVPSDIVLAARYLSGNGDPGQIPNEPWDDSVKALTHYPALLQWLSQNLDWTTQLGDAFLSQPADVMDAIQQLRAQASAAGTLVNTPQQQVLADDGNIDIEPTDPNAIYMPEYDPDAVYDEGYSADAGPLIGFGPVYPVGPWLDYGVDWRHRSVYVGGNANNANARTWQPGRVRSEARPANQGYLGVSRPKPLPGVRIPHGTRAAGALTTPTGYPRRDFTGWGQSRPSVRTVQPRAAAPAVVPAERTPGTFNDYRRGSDAREASIRGQLSRQAQAAPVVNRPPPESFRPASAFHMSAGPAANAFSARGAASRGRR